jgi:LmbE family N-acetylglucosaminyl deacetylase
VGFALVSAQGQRNLSGEVEIRQAFERLGTLGSAMMIAAHPDDENTAMVAWLARGRHVRIAYLSLTRGEGGQNLIGSEQGDEMGVIRTQELQAARRIDGGEQYFTRAIDFGFTKTADETLGAKWPRDKVLGDVVWNIRRFRPDVIILRFSGTPRDGHGQHQASAILGREAFSAAADPNRFPEQLQYVQPWQAKRLLTNVAAFTTQQEREAAATPGRLEVDLGEYSPELGYSYGEIAGMSRSQHRSQAMGTAERKGSQKNYLLTLAGDIPSKDLFDGMNLTWSRFPGGAGVGETLKQTLDSFVPAHPEALLPALAGIRPRIASIAQSTKDPLAVRKLGELDELMALCAGVSLEAQADKFAVTPGASLKVNLTAMSRLPTQVTLTGIALRGMDGAPAVEVAPTVLVNNQPSQHSATFRIPLLQPYSGPYWLDLPKDGELYSVADQRDVGNPENRPALEAAFRLRIAGTDLELIRPVQHRYVDRVYGELVRPLAIVPPVAVALAEKSLVFGDGKPRRVEVPVRSNAAKQSGEVRLELPAGWKAEPPTQHFELAFTDELTTVAFQLTPPAAQGKGKLRAIAKVGEREIAMGTELIQYSHIPVQTLFPPAEAELVRTDLKILSKNVGYVMGAGDEVPATLRQMGCDVTLLSSEDLMRGDLARFDAIVTGVRAWNTRADLRANYQRLYDYAQKGGTVVVQYNVPEGGGGPGAGQGGGQAGGAANPGAAANPPAAPAAPAAAAPAPPVPAPGRQGNGPPADNTTLEHLGPYPMRISRNDRVTVEEAPVTFPNPQISLLNAPNKITQADFEGWIQERGLYFADQWDPKYQSVLESHDPGEKPLPGGMLFTRLGKGAYVFTAYSWFRELPAGVPGAYRIFANLLSAGKVQ